MASSGAHFNGFTTALNTVETEQSDPSQKEHAVTAPPETTDLSNKDLRRNTSHVENIRHRIGLHSHAPIDEAHDLEDYQDLLWPKIRLALREPFAEFFGVFIMVLFGDGSVAQVLLSAGQQSAPGKNGYGNYQSISWGWGLGVMLGIYVAGDSGGEQLLCVQSGAISPKS